MIELAPAPGKRYLPPVGQSQKLDFSYLLQEVVKMLASWFKKLSAMAWYIRGIRDLDARCS